MFGPVLQGPAKNTPVVEPMAMIHKLTRKKLDVDADAMHRTLRSRESDLKHEVARGASLEVASVVPVLTPQTHNVKP